MQLLNIHFFKKQSVIPRFTVYLHHNKRYPQDITQDILT